MNGTNIKGANHLDVTSLLVQVLLGFAFPLQHTLLYEEMARPCIHQLPRGPIVSYRHVGDSLMATRCHHPSFDHFLALIFDKESQRFSHGFFFFFFYCAIYCFL